MTRTRNQKDEVSSRHVNYTAHEHQVTLVNEVYGGVDTVKQHLFQFPQELATTFNTRQDRSTLRNFVKRAVAAFTGMIFRKPMEVLNYGARTTRSFAKIDTKNSIYHFTEQITNSATKDGITYILIDSPSKENTNDNVTGPYLQHIERSQLINWRKDANGHFTMIVIEEVVEEPVGEFGTSFITQWRHYKDDGTIVVYRNSRDSNDASVRSTSDYYEVSRTVSDYKGVPLIEINIDEVPILYDIAKMNIKHYNRQSHKDRYLTMAALPIPLIWGADLDDTGNPTSAKPALVIGVDEAFIFTGTKQDSDFEWRELSGDSIDLLEKDLDSIIEDITTGILRAAETSNAVQKTATEVQLLQAEASNRVSTISSAVETGMKEALVILSEFNLEKVPDNATFKLSRDFNASLMGNDGMRVVLESYMMGLMSIETFLTTMSDMELISIESAEKEIERIKKDNFEPTPNIKDAEPTQDNRTKAAVSKE